MGRGMRQERQQLARRRYPWIRAIRAISGFSFSGEQPNIVYADAVPTMMELLTDAKTDTHANSDFNRGLVVASRAIDLLKTANRLLEVPSRQYFTLPELWEHVLETLHWRVNIRPDKVAEVMAALTEGRMNCPESIKARPAPSKKFQALSDEMGQWISILSKQNFRPHPNHRQRRRLQRETQRGARQNQGQRESRLLSEAPENRIQVQAAVDHPRAAGEASPAGSSAPSIGLHQNGTQAETLLVRIQALEEENSKLRGENSKLQSKNSNLRNEKSELKNEIEAMEAHCDQVQASFSRLTGSCDAHKAMLERFWTDISSLQSENARLRAAASLNYGQARNVGYYSRLH
ncbi:hypothetical protein CPLU01_09756 [Colletotrichum plurivorum]|uniref:Uncharacterized protein n=1 Tax=Colletotrichum plurivorum TaxID=2175906 RepID=A0A8H6K7Q9_9PEZI|nr:hypothetical protein CPLU01_09756 [Colletotrichum plurivorum]